MRRNQRRRSPLFDRSLRRVSPEDLRIAEAMVFASAEPLEEATIAARLSAGADVDAVMAELQRALRRTRRQSRARRRRWTFRTAPDLAWLLAREGEEKRKLSRAAIETLAIVAYHQPVTRADIEEIRGVAVSKGALDVLMEAGWVRMRGRRKAPGRPITYGTTAEFLIHFGLDAIARPARPRRTAGRRPVRRQAAGRLRRAAARRRRGAAGGRGAARRAGRARPGLGAESRRRGRIELIGGDRSARSRRHESAENAADSGRRASARGETMDPRLPVGAAALLWLAPSLRWPTLRGPAARLASRRPMTSRSSTLRRRAPSGSAQTPISATGLIAYEFRGSPAKATPPISAS